MKTETAPFVTGSIRWWLRAEGLAILVAGLWLYSHHGFGWGRFFALLLVPDISFLGYLINSRVGAISYNLLHSTIGPLTLAVIGCVTLPAALPLALIWLSHVGMDRLLGYGLKYPSAFGHTHLGRVGRAAA